ncbi:hypothetical protein F4814DRAFT_433045 [Daldinia grandis]|nr:hypothetical protein F4814DRAFT_433045 [Daldinia grandis]
MAESSTGTHVAFPPYNSNNQNGQPILNWRLFHIQDVPPSAITPSEEQSPTGSAQGEPKNRLTEPQKQELLEEINRLLDTPEQVKSVIQKCRSLGLDLDIDRLVRFAVSRGFFSIVKYLIEEENANPTRLDILDRSALFYVRRPYPDNPLLEYSVGRDRFTVEHLNHRDKMKWAPLHYAARYRDFYYIEYLLLLGADAEIRSGDGKMPIELLGIDNYYKKICTLLFAFWKLRQLYPHLTNVYLYHVWDRPETVQLGILDSNSKLFEGPGPKWCHIPWTNGIMVFAALRQLERAEQGSYIRRIYRSWFQGAAPVLSNPKLSCRKPSYESDYSRPASPFVSIVLPYLVLRTKNTHTQLKKETLELRSSIPDDFAQSVVQLEQTLDETYYSALSVEALARRNNDQVVSRECIKTLDGEHIDDNKRPILVVSQLWLWRSGDHIITADSEEASCLQPTSTNISLERHRSIAKEIGNIKFSDISMSPTPRIIAHRISEFGNPQAGGMFPPPLEIFEIGVVRILSDVEAYTDPNMHLLPEDIEKERSFMHRIADVREELVMIQEILCQQKDILQRLIQDIENKELNTSDPAKEPWEVREWEGFKLSAKDIDNFQKRAAKIDRDAERIENLIQNQLNMKRTYASIRDARTGLILSAAVIGFTVITIIFAPLAFMTSLFALPIEGLLRNQYQLDGGNGKDSTSAYTTKYVATWFVVAEVVSLVVTIFLVVLCLWLFGGIGNFSAVRGNYSNNTVAGDRGHSKNKPSIADKTSRSVGEKNSGSDRGKTGMRRRMTKNWSRPNQGESSMV